MGKKLVPSLLGRCKQKQRGLRGLLCRRPSITEWEMFITAQGCRLRNDLYCVEWDVKIKYTIPYHSIGLVSVSVLRKSLSLEACFLKCLVNAVS